MSHATSSVPGRILHGSTTPPCYRGQLWNHLELSAVSLMLRKRWREASETTTITLLRQRQRMLTAAFTKQ